MRILIVKALTKSNTYYIFRDDNTEVEVIINDNKIKSFPLLTDEEKEYINKNILKCHTKKD